MKLRQSFLVHTFSILNRELFSNRNILSRKPFLHLLETRPMKKLSLILITLISCHGFAEEIPGKDLLTYFSANYRTQGEWTRAAIADSTALIEALKSISQDADCRSVGGAVAQLGLLTQQLQSLEKTNETQVKIAEYNAQEQELLLQISQTTNPTTLSEINKTLRDLQVMRAGLLGKDKIQADLASQDKVQALSNVVLTANATFSQITGNQKCLNKHPSVLNTATSVVSAIGATVSVVNPVLGIGLTAGAAFMGETIEGVKRYRNSRDIRKIADNSIALEAYKCALETMSERWCQMRDAESFLVFKANQRQHPRLGSELGVAIRLNDRELPVLIEWLNKIRSGVTPTTTADASRQNAVFTRENYVRSLEAYGLGLIEENRIVFQSYQDLNERWNFLRSIIKSLIPSTDVGFRNPFYDVLTSGYAPFFLLGLEDNADIRNAEGDYYSIDSWSKPDNFQPTLDLVLQKYIEWITKSRNRVNQELTQVLQPDALQTLSSAYDRSGNRWKISPMDSLKRITEFLEAHPPRERDIAFRKLYGSTLEKLKQIYRITEEAILLDDPIYKNTPVEEVYELAQLRYGTVVIQARMDMIIRLALLELLETSPPEDQVVVAQLLAAERFTETITKMSGTDNLALIRADINRAQPITIGNLNSFMDIFGKNINRILNKLENEERFSTGTIARAKRYARTELCFLLLSVPDIHNYVNTTSCAGLKMNSIINGGPESVTLSQDVFKRDLNDRACVYREFFRSSKIFETWGIK